VREALGGADARHRGNVGRELDKDREAARKAEQERAVDLLGRSLRREEQLRLDRDSLKRLKAQAVGAGAGTRAAERASGGDGGSRAMAAPRSRRARALFRTLS
jgi:hypothetical protein